MPITESQRERRRKHLGGSDLPALFGLGWSTLGDVWASKVFATEDTPNAAMAAGTLLESPVLDWAEQHFGKLRRNCYRRVEGSPIAPSIDAIVEETGEPVEAKTSGITGPVYGDWGDEGTDEVPEHVIVQCHGHMMATKAEVCHVPVLLGGRGFVMFHVPRVQRLCDTIMALAERFWSDHVVKRVAPDSEWGAMALPSLEILRRIKRVPGKLATIEPDLVRRFETARDFEAMVAKEKKARQAELLAALGDAEGALLPGGQMVKYMEQKRKGYTVEPGTMRVLRIVKTPQALLEAQA